MINKDSATIIRQLNILFFDDEDIPTNIKFDNGKEFCSNIMKSWAKAKGIVLDFGRVYTPTD